MKMIGGLIRAQVYGPQGLIKYADDFFDCETDSWEIIANAMDEVLSPILPARGVNKSHWQSGFGGDEGNGLIDYWLPEKITALPDVIFTIEGVEYKMVFQVDDQELVDYE